MSITIQIIVTDEQHKKLQDEAKSKGISVSQLAKSRVFREEGDFELIWNEFLGKLTTFPSNKEFTIADVMTENRWKELDRSSKMSIAHSFNRGVKSGEYDNITLLGRSRYNTSIYCKSK